MTLTRNQWLLLGAVVFGLIAFVYLMFFCPTECH